MTTHLFERLRVAAAPALLVLAVAGCAPAAAGAAPIGVTLRDDALVLDRHEVAAGTINFDISNQGEFLHEVEVFSGATDGQVLPIKSSIADTTGLTLVDEIENILPRSDASLVVDLPPGTYLVICNLSDHYAAGMWDYLTVEEAAG